jgi:hypothetical protein
MGGGREGSMEQYNQKVQPHCPFHFSFFFTLFTRDSEVGSGSFARRNDEAV